MTIFVCNNAKSCSSNQRHNYVRTKYGFAPPFIELQAAVLLFYENHFESLPGYYPMYNDFSEPQMRIEEAEVPGLEESVRDDVHPLTVLNAQL